MSYLLPALALGIIKFLLFLRLTRTMATIIAIIINRSRITPTTMAAISPASKVSKKKEKNLVKLYTKQLNYMNLLVHYNASES